LTGTFACDPGAGVTWVNQTDQTLVIYLSDEVGSGRGNPFPPHSTTKQAVIKHVWKNLVVVRDEQGNVLFRQELTWDEFKAQGFRFVITEDMISPPSPTPAPSPGITPTP
jgi:hypothetical protein